MISMAENKFMDTPENEAKTQAVDFAAICEYVLSRVYDDLASYGYKRSGKGKLFYRYTAGGKVGCAVEMKKSMFNSSESFSFTFNISCVALYELKGYAKEKLTLEALKRTAGNSFGGMRIGSLCRGGDYWWEITADIANEYPMEEYYNRFVRNDIEKAACYLEELACKKEQVYH